MKGFELLTLTQAAASTVRELTSKGPPATGVRLHIGSTRFDGRGTPIVIEVAPWPDLRDSVLENDGARLYVEPETLLVLDHKMLDVRDTGDRQRFVLLEQPDLEFA